MSDTIIVALISLVGIIITALATYGVSKSENAKTIAVVQNEIKNIKDDIGRLEKKQDKHNNLMERVFKLEQKIEDMK